MAVQSEDKFKKFPYEIVDFDESGIENLKQQKGSCDLVEVGNMKWKQPKSYRVLAEEMYNFKVRSDDVFVSTYPRSGTTLTQELVWLLCNDLNFDKAKESTMDEVRFPYFEHELCISDAYKKLISVDVSHKRFEAMQGRRFIKTHFPISLMPHQAFDETIGAKVVYVARNPRDVIVSMFHFQRLIGHFEGEFEEFIPLFLEDLLTDGPYCEHIETAWNFRHNPNFLFLFYEDLVNDLQGTAKKLSKFLNQKLSDEDIPKLMNHLNVDNFKNNPSVNHKTVGFVRRGKVGGNPEMTPEIATKVNEWFASKIKNVELKAKLLKN